MKKVLEWMNRWSLLLMILAVGTVYLTVNGEWSVYAVPFGKLWECLRAEEHESMQEEAVSSLDAQNTSDSRVGSEEVCGEGNTVSDGDTESGQEVSVSDSDAEVVHEPVYITVEDDYFADAVFIGDSRTVGLYEYGGLEEIATFYASTGLTVYKVFDAPIAETAGKKEKMTVEQALSSRQFSKIYLMMGINEMGTGTVESFAEKYAQVVARLRELQPDAIIYLQAIMKVTTERSEQGDYITNEGIEQRNEKIAQLADNVNIFYLDVNPMLTDDSGGMESSYTYDGVHLKAQYVSIWKDFLKTRAVQN